jgi:cytochrome c553
MRYLPAFTSILFCASTLASAQTSTSPGLRLTLHSDGTRDSRVSRLAALYVPEQEAPSPFLKKGPFTAEYTGFLTLEARHRLFFSAEGNGSLTVSINLPDDSEITFSRQGHYSKTNETERLRLNPGSYPIRVVYKSPESGDAGFRLYWRESRNEWPQEPVPPTAWSHTPDDDLTQSLLKRRGRQLIADLHCAKCHATDIHDNAMLELGADVPSFSGIGSRLHPAWMAEWINNPKAVRHQARMPRLIHSEADKDAENIAAYLATLTDEAPELIQGDVRSGGQLFHNLGCIGCHTLPGTEKQEDTYQRLSLNHVNQKFKPGALTAFLLNPARHYAWIRMPDFKFSKQEAADLAAWLRSNTPQAKPAIHGNAELGKTEAAEHGCMNCHAPQEAKLKAPTLKDLTWSGGCLDGNFADYTLTDEDKAAILAVRSELGSLHQSSTVEFAHRQIETLNCHACHRYDGTSDRWSTLEDQTAHLNHPDSSHHQIDQSRPLLTWVGEKLNAQWSEDLLAGELSYKPRPWLTARMPVFNSRANGLARGLSHEHGYSSIKPEFKQDKELAELGRTLTGLGGFGCVVCHDVGTGKATAPFEVKGLNLAYAHDRLRYDYFLRWMQHPQRVVDTTKMPRYSIDGTSAFPQLEGNADEQYRAIWHYTADGMQLTPPDGAK